MFTKIYNYYFSRERGFVRELTNILGFIPQKLYLYQRAFTHKSNSKMDDKYDIPLNNERLEYLGDALLDAIMAEFLFKKYPRQDEGFLTQMRSKLVNRKTLNNIAAKMELDVFLRQHGSSRISQTMMGNTFEAFIGAVYLDVGYEKTKKFIVNRLLKQYINVHKLESQNNNFKSQLLEYSQKHNKTIAYNLISHYRTNSNRERFKIEVTIDGESVSNAEDFSKKSAEQKASELALLKIGVLNNSGDNQED